MQTKNQTLLKIDADIARIDTKLDKLDAARQKSKAEGAELNEKKRGLALLRSALAKSAGGVDLKVEEKEALKAAGIDIGGLEKRPVQVAKAR